MYVSVKNGFGIHYLRHSNIWTLKTGIRCSPKTNPKLHQLQSTYMVNSMYVCIEQDHYLNFVINYLPVTSKRMLLSVVRFGVALITPSHWYALLSSAVVNNEIL